MDKLAIGIRVFCWHRNCQQQNRQNCDIAVALLMVYVALDVVSAHDDRVLAPLYGKINNMKIAIHTVTPYTVTATGASLFFSRATHIQHSQNIWLFHITIYSWLRSRCLGIKSYSSAVKLNHHHHHCHCHCFPHNRISQWGWSSMSHTHLKSVTRTTYVVFVFTL